MQTAETKAAAPADTISIIDRPAGDCIFRAQGRNRVFLRAGVTIAMGGGEPRTTEEETEVEIPAEALVPGSDFFIRMEDGRPVAFRPCSADTAGILGGLHFAPGGNATARAGGDTVPAINPYSCWDADFRPACPDPRGMALVDNRFWADIYLLGRNHLASGTSRCGAVIADGVSRPSKIAGEGRCEKLDYATAVEIYAHHGKQLLGAEEFFAAAYGVKERASRDEEPESTGDIDNGAAAFTSKWGLFDITGTMWQWGTDGDPDNPRASFFGGSWIDGSVSGSRCAHLACWPGNSHAALSARGRSDHRCLTPA